MLQAPLRRANQGKRNGYTHSSLSRNKEKSVKMKYLRFAASVMLVLLLVACTITSFPTAEKEPLHLQLSLTEAEVHSFDDIQVQIVLVNQSQTSFLVHSRLYFVGVPVDAPFSEMLILISDSNGNEVANYHVYPNYRLPSVDTLTELQPGDKVSRIFYLSGDFFNKTMFKRGEKYTIVAIYQNDLDITQTIDGVAVSSWIGSVRSNEETFVILP